MSKTIHIHIHRAPAKDAWEESKHKRATNGQFGSGGGGAAAKPAAKSAPAAAKKPAIAVKQATSGSSALARLQAQSNEHLKKTGFGHLVTPPKNAPGTGVPKKSFEQHVKETRAAQLAAAARKSLGIKEPGAPKPAAKSAPAAKAEKAKRISADAKPAAQSMTLREALTDPKVKAEYTHWEEMHSQLQEKAERGSTDPTLERLEKAARAELKKKYGLEVSA